MNLVLRDLVCRPSASSFAGVRNLRKGSFSCRRDKFGSTRSSLSFVCFWFCRCAKCARGADGINWVLRNLVCRASASGFVCVRNLRRGCFCADGINKVLRDLVCLEKSIIVQPLNTSKL